MQVDINDLTGAQSTITSQLQSDPTIDAVLALNPAVAAVAFQPRARPTMTADGRLMAGSAISRA